MIFISNINNHNRYLYLKYNKVYNEYYIDIQQYDIIHKYIIDSGYDLNEFYDFVIGYFTEIYHHNGTNPAYDTYRPEYVEWKDITIIDYTAETYYR